MIQELTNSCQAVCVALAMLLTGCVAPQANETRRPFPVNEPSLTQRISPADAHADLDEFLEWTAATHPDLSYTTDLDALSNSASTVRESLNRVETRRDAWAQLALLNPVFADAHTGLRLPDQLFDEWVDKGGFAFPAPVIVANGKATLAETGTEILSINGMQVSGALAWLMPRIRGEDDTIRERILSLRFALALWTYGGGATSYVVETLQPDGSAKTLTFATASNNATALAEADSYRLSFAGDAAIIVIDTFDIAQEERFSAFLEQAFSRISLAQPKRLIIDLRDNGGGARDLSDQLMAYLTRWPYSPISAVTARIVPANQQLIPGSVLGDVVSLPFTQLVNPPAKLSNRYTGDVWILIGPNTYSQSIVFAATARDHGVARLAGTPTRGRANQTGQVQRKTLGNTGFEAQSPIYVFTRYSGDDSADVLKPDTVLDEATLANHSRIAERLQ